MSGSDLTAPTAAEVEVSIFGPGVGESVVLHLGGGDWAVIDSCRHPDGTSMPLSYLQALAVRPESVKLIVASHWHDDHIAGLADLYRACPCAKFACSLALRSDEFLTLVSDPTERFVPSTGVDEFRAILRELETRAAGIRREARGPSWAQCDKLLLRGDSYSVHALAPSDAALTLALREIGTLLPKPSEPKRRVVAQSPNHTAVVLWIQAGTQRVLLGADLEATPNPATGWSAVLMAGCRAGKAGVFKVPHHGSSNGHLDRVWEDLLISEPYAVVTPYVRGGVRLPTPSDIDRIRRLTPNAFVTSQPRLRAPPPKEKAVERTLAESGVKRRVMEPSVGHVRLRLPVDGAATAVDVMVSGSAARLGLS